MRVTHIITRLVLGGAQENTLATIAGLQRLGVEVKLITGPTIGPEGSLETEAEKIFNSRLSTSNSRLVLVPELVRPVHPPKDFIALRNLEKILREQKPDIVHTHSGKAGILGRLAAQEAGVPVIVHHIHGPSFGSFQGALANFVFTAAEKRAAKVTRHFFCSADAMTRRYLAAGIGRPEMFTRIFSGFNLQPFLGAANDLSLRKRLGIGENDFVIAKVGRIFKLKGHADLVSAFAKILPQVPGARLLFVGDGTLRGEIASQIRALGLGDKVVFAGLVPPGEVARYIGVADCVAHLSYREALSRVLPQALAAGKPVVAYDFDGADEVCLENKTGFTVRMGDTDAAARRLLQLASDPALRRHFGETGRAFVKENFSVEKMVDDQYAVYVKLLERKTMSNS
jgi:glycosyltransferase involved in cell wall biosynthesis